MTREKGAGRQIVIRTLFMLVLLFCLAWGAFYLYEQGALPDVGKTIADAKVLATVKTAISLHSDLSERPVSVRVQGGIVTLSGEVARVEERAEAERIAATSKGVDRVDNLIAVSPELEQGKSAEQPSLGRRLDDATLLAKVKTSLTLHRELSELNLAVNVQDGTVFLEGEAMGADQAERVRHLVRNVRGVESVELLLRVSETTGTIEQIAAQIETILAQNRDLRAYPLSSSVKDGEIVLEGEVATGAERQLAELLSERLAGNRRLRNEIRILPR